MIGPLRRRTVERMARGAGEETRLTYLAEHYHPGFAVEELGRLAARVRESIAELELEGKQVRYLRTTIVPRDESFLLVLEATSEDLVREAYAPGRRSVRPHLDDSRRRGPSHGQQPQRNRSEGGQMKANIRARS